MPRIDPERLLRCLQPLLDPTTGAIRSSEEVDKILGLMSKFSKKLVSKCIYINILKATHPTVLDLFMQRGGWSLIFGWANESVSAKNYPLIKEVLNLLLITPTTVPRLKENKFPILVKGLSKECEVEEIKNLAKQVVSKWIVVAKAEDAAKSGAPLQHQVELQPQLQPQPVQVPIVGTGLGLPDSNNIIPQDLHTDLGNLAMNTAPDSLLNLEPTLIPDAETTQLMDLDISHSDLANIDFNLDILSKVVDQHNLDVNLGVEPTSSGATIHNISEDHNVIPQSRPADSSGNLIFTNTNVVTNADINNMAPAQSIVHTEPQVQPQPPQAVNEEVYRMIPVQPAPKIYIKTVGGQKTVVQSISSESGPYFMVIKDGKNVLMRLKEPPQPVATPIIIQQAVPEVSSNTPTPNSTTKSQETTDGKEVKNKKSSKKDSSPVNKSKVPGDATIKTYSKSKPTSSKDPNKKVADQNLKPSQKSEKEKDKDNKKVSSKEKSTSDATKKSKSSSSSSKAAQAAAIAKQQAEDEKLREEIRKQKAMVKKRLKEAEKQKQLEKDQETLKKLNLAPPSSSGSSTSSLKIPKIPRKTNSFTDAIGIPGADGSATVDKIKKVSPEKTLSKSNTNNDDNATPTSPVKKEKFYGKKEEDDIESEKPKERRHKPKVFVSSKSRSEDLLNEMTGSAKSKTAKEKEKEKEKEEVKPTISSLGNSIVATPPAKLAKRLSTDSIEKPGDAKKPKLSDPNAKTEKDNKAKEKEANKDASKDKEKKKPATTIKESSLFMDCLNASSETTKPVKRKRRPSISGDKDKPDVSSPVEKSPKVKDDDESSDATQDSASDEPVKKPFNFYRDTLNDSVDEENNEGSDQSAEKDSGAGSDETTDQEHNLGSFIPQESDGVLKSALCLHRARNRPRKSVRWREEDELREFHYFEMDETERVNVTKQKEFTELTKSERLGEQINLRRIAEEDDSPQWRMPKIAFTTAILQPPILSQEKDIQEERERNVLGLFLPPGAALPDSAVEPDPVDAIIPVDRVEQKTIPVEDVNGITKVCDFRTTKWPVPEGATGGAMLGFGRGPVKEIGDNLMQSPVNAFPAANDYNPWSASLGFNVPPPGAAVPNIGNIGEMSQFPPFNVPPPNAMGIINPGQPPPVAMGFATPNPFAFPAAMVPPPVNGPPQIDGFGGGNLNRDQRLGMTNNNRGSRFNDTDQRRNFHGRDGNGRDRGGSSRDRDYRDDRGGRDRDYRRRDNNDRDYRFHDRDRNNRDFRGGGGRSIRKDIPCKFFKKGFCHMGSRCEFLHDGSNSHHDDRSNSHSRHDSSSYDSRSRRSPDSNSNKDVDHRQSGGGGSSSVDAEDWESRSEPTPVLNDTNATRFAQPPSSPTEPEMPTFNPTTESTKVIPV